jgi:hypothetical protein
VPATAIHAPMLEDLVDRPGRQQRPAVALMAMLGALLAPRPVLAALGRGARRIVARRLDELRDERPTRGSSCAIRSSC